MKKTVLFSLLFCWILAFKPVPYRPNIVLISIDTLRADYFTPEYMPLTYQWAKEHGTIYTQAYAPSTWTLPSHISMFSGLLPSEHNDDVANTPMVMDKLQNLGYTTYGFTGAGYLSRHFKWNKKFDRFEEIPLEKFQDRIKDFQWPFFLFIHTYYVHNWLSFNEKKQPMEQGNPSDLYAKKVNNCDSVLRDFIDHVPSDSLIILTSDHGEMLGENGLYCHGTKPYQLLTHVPLIISGTPKTIDIPVSLMDLPSILLGDMTIKQPIVSEFLSVEGHVPITILGGLAVKPDGNLYRAKLTSAGYMIDNMGKATSTSALVLSTEAKNHLKSLGYLN